MTVDNTVTDPAPRLFLFGPMSAEDASEAVELPAGNAQRLLAYLVLHPRVAHRRESLVDTLWTDLQPEQARRALSDTVYRLRARGHRWLRAGADTVALDDRLWTDVWEFDELVASGSPDDLVAAIDLYRADLVPSIYDDWIAGHRVARRQAYLAAVARVTETREQQGDLLGGLLLARQLVVAEPYDERGHQAYLRLLGRLGRAGEALSHYDDLRRSFADELGCELLPGTVAIAESIASERIVGAARDDRAASPFVGRVLERATALDAVDAALNGRGSIVGIEGPAGIGKSRLLGEVLAGARWRGATATAAGVSGVPEVSALAPLANAIAPVLRGASLIHVESTLEPSMLAMLAAVHPDWAAAGTQSVLVEHAEARVADAHRALGVAIASTGRVVLAIDDMHRATATLWRAFAAFADGFVAAGGLLVITYRRPEIEATGGWPLLQDWDRAGIARFVGLSPLSATEVGELLGDDDADPEQVLALTGGIPFYVTAWSGQLASGTGAPDARALVDTRLRALPASARAAIDAAAVIGEDVPYRLWADVSGEPPMMLAGTAEGLAAERWVTPSGTGYAFTHDLVRTAVYDLMEPRQRADVHRRVAEALAVRDPLNSRARAFHLDRAGLTVEAAAMYVDAARQARQAFSFHESVDALDRALAMLPRNDGRRLDVALALAESCEIVGDRDRQRPLLGVVVDDARGRGDDAVLLRALIVAGSAHARTDDPASGERLLAEATEVATRLGDPLSIALAAYRYADVKGQQGEWAAAVASANDALVQARLAGDLTLLGGVLRMRGIAARYTGDPAGSLRWLEEAVAVHRASGDRLEELNSAANLTGAYYELCAWDALQEVTDELLPRAIAYGAPGIVGILLHQSGLAAMALGDRATARARMTAARESFAGANRQRLVGLVVNTLGLVAEDDGDFDEALEFYRSALATADSLDAATESAYACHDLGALLARLGHADEAIPLLERAMTTWERHDNAVALAKTRAHLALALLTLERVDDASRLADLGLATLRSGFPPGEQAQGWLWTLYRVLTELGRRDEAWAVLVAADAELERQAAAIADPERRRQFLERVPQNRSIADELAIVEGAASPTVDPTVISIELASVGAPLGRPLRPDELVAVDWTVTAPGDDAIADGPARRRHRLARLLAEAAAAGAAPTDSDLARVLGVSRRTILRDMAVSGEASGPSTRRRLRSHGAG